MYNICIGRKKRQPDGNVVLQSLRNNFSNLCELNIDVDAFIGGT